MLGSCDFQNCNDLSPSANIRLDIERCLVESMKHHVSYFVCENFLGSFIEEL